MNKEEKINAIKKWLASGSINLFGLPYSGKDTQAGVLAEFLNAPVIGGGDIIRASQQESLKNLTNTGSLAPQDEYLALVLPYLSQEKYSGKPLVLSSVGRWIGEEASVIDAAQKSQHPIMTAIHLKISEDDARARWQHNNRGRADDANEEIFNRRLAEFREKTVPVLEKYRKLGLLIEVDGTQSIEEVEASIIEALHEKSRATCS